MIKLRWFWVALLILIAITIPGIMDRWEKETNNNTYEIVVPYHEIEQLATETENLNTDDILATLKKAGLNTVSINQISLKWMEEHKLISIYSEQELRKALLFSKNDSKINTAEEGYYITQPEEANYKQLIEQNLQPSTTTIGDQTFYFIKKKPGLLSTNFAFNKETIEQVKANGLDYIFRIGNEDQPFNQSTVSQLIEMKKSGSNKILFSGQELIGYPNMTKVENWTNSLTKNGFQFYFIEFNLQKGLQTVARNADYNIIRLHSLHLDNKSLPENVDQAVRAVKERNIRSIFFHLQTGKPEDSLKNATAFVESVHDKLASDYTQGTPTPFSEIKTPTWLQILLFAAGILFTGLGSTLLKNNKWIFISTIFMSILALAYLLTQKLFLLQGFALMIAILAPICAMLSTMRSTNNNIRDITVQYFKALGITFIGIMIVIGLLNGNPFITGFEVFRGVKLVYVIPIIFVAVFLLWREALKLLNVPVKYWHLIIFLIIGAIGIYYITRTGNNATVSGIELILRSALEDLLYVRPRTKEFLIGFPFFLLAIYVIGSNRLIGKLLLIPGTIGFLSVMNTFTHLHIPLHISLLRTVYSIAFGYLIGLLLIFLYKKCAPIVTKYMIKGWR
ncbi:DUF5693 family protein [Virgibacillus pantothenticus]|uniref:DUF5693 family protein n=1 Tax=Virgibacillus pantothenticus TaxID=1473 RepID=UPI0025B0CF10|nr:DUF5693 family protein [Virgibacillus pantothenticus]